MIVIKKSQPVPENCKKLFLTNGGFTFVDADLYEELNKHKWRKAKSEGTFYVVRGQRINGKYQLIYMHRHIMDTPPLQICHHENTNSFHNYRSNLRNVTEREHRHFDGWHIFEK